MSSTGNDNLQPIGLIELEFISQTDEIALLKSFLYKKGLPVSKIYLKNHLLRHPVKILWMI